MDKIDFFVASLINPSIHSGAAKHGAKKTSGEIKGKNKTLFSEILRKAVPEEEALGLLKELPPSEEALAELMDAVHSTGSDLAERPFQEEILRYKKAVRNFIHYVIENAFAIEKSQTRRRGKIKTHVQIRIIDSKLEELAAAILSGQTKQLDRVSKIDEIKGLLVDLTISGVIRERDG
jgi:uncharacterized protein YaaR (DUF327 family)